MLIKGFWSYIMNSIEESQIKTKNDLLLFDLRNVYPQIRYANLILDSL